MTVQRSSTQAAHRQSLPPSRSGPHLGTEQSASSSPSTSAFFTAIPKLEQAIGSSAEAAAELGLRATAHKGPQGSSKPAATASRYHRLSIFVMNRMASRNGWPVNIINRALVVFILCFVLPHGPPASGAASRPGGLQPGHSRGVLGAPPLGPRPAGGSHRPMDPQLTR